MIASGRQYSQHEEREHEPSDQVDSNGISQFPGRGIGVGFDDTAGWDEDGGVRHPEGAIG